MVAGIYVSCPTVMSSSLGVNRAVSWVKSGVFASKVPPDFRFAVGWCFEDIY